MSNETVTAIPSPGKTTPDHVIAFEVAKHDLVVHTLPADRQCTIANTPAAVRRLLKAEIKHNAQARLGTLLVVCEATGGYERHVLHGAVELGLEVHRAHAPRATASMHASWLSSAGGPRTCAAICRPVPCNSPCARSRSGAATCRPCGRLS